MRALSSLVLPTLLVASPLPRHSAAQAQSFVRLSFQTDRDTESGGFRFRLQEPDNPAHPQLWQGPLSVAGGTSRCTVGVSLVRDVYLSRGGDLLIVVSQSGSHTAIDFFRPAGCAPRWRGLRAFTHGVRVEEGRLTLLPACECGEEGRPCSCSAGTIYRLSGAAQPQRLAAASLALTRRELGVPFSGTRRLADVPAAYRP